MDKEILAIIAARGGSKGLPGKNIKELCGKPLISYTIEAAKEAKYITRVVVSTDDNDIARVSKELGADIPCMRPDELATDNASSIDAVLHMVNYLKEVENYNPEFIVLLQPTSPLRNSKHIDEAIEKLLETKMDAIVSVCESEVSPYWSNVFNENKLEYFIEEGKKITRRQDLPNVYRMNGAIYGIKTDVFIKEKTFEPESLTGYIMSNKDSVDIDEALDFKFAEIIMKEELGD